MTTPNQQTPYSTRLHELVIWAFHDGKAGHLSQLRGLLDRLQELSPCNIHWLDIQANSFQLKDLLRSSSKYANLPSPNLVIGAGHATHKSILLAAWKHHALSCCVMSPSLPHSLFDAVICPEHDGFTETNNRLITFGPINPIRPDKLAAEETRNQHLIVIGGPSKHFEFDSLSLIKQVKELCQTRPEANWLLSTSPRTPEEFLVELHAEKIPNLKSYDYRSPELAPLKQLLITSKEVWLSPDSMSMVHEALSAGTNVNLFSLKPKKRTRLTQHIEQLEQRGFVNQHSHQLKPNIPWEADRAAQFLLDKLHQKNA